MRFSDLKNLVSSGESSWLEFKRIIPSPHKIAREMCAFANSKGGVLMIGIDDDKTIVGVDSYYEQEFLLDEAANFLCDPAIEHIVEVFPHGKKDVIIVRVQEAELKPVMVNTPGKPSAGFIRVNDKSIRASREMLKVLKNRTSGHDITFDYGKNEQKLFRFLNEYERITVNEFSNLVNISKRRASRILVNLVSAGVLNLFTHEKADYYTLVHSDN
jgi:predicted HTH transcriptional regulator